MLDGDSIYEDKFRRRFTGKINHNLNCGAWIGAKDSRGYGWTYYKGKMKSSHHSAWYLTYGYWPTYLLHTCDILNCVNVLHLREGTHQDNMIDKKLKDRQAKGMQIGISKLSNDQASEVFALRGSLSQVSIAEMYGVSQNTISYTQTKRYFPSKDNS